MDRRYSDIYLASAGVIVAAGIIVIISSAWRVAPPRACARATRAPRDSLPALPTEARCHVLNRLIESRCASSRRRLKPSRDSCVAGCCATVCSALACLVLFLLWARRRA